jgi:predicted secreted protein
MKKISSILFILSLGIILLAGCGSGPRTVKVDEGSSGQTVEMKAGEILELHLKSDPINGYSWQVEKIDPNYLEASKEIQYTPEGQDPVVGGTQVLTFKTLKSGITNLGLIYKRSSGEGVNLPKTFDIQVNIK